MQQFKDKDWLRVIAGHERPINSVFQIKSCLTRYKLSDVELWQPKHGEWCFNEFNGLVKILETIDTHLASARAYNPFTEKECIVTLDQCEPFIGELPSFLKEQK